MVLKRLHIAIAASAAVFASGFTEAASCDLKQVASIPATLTRHNELLLDAVINNQPEKIQLDTGASVSVLSKKFVERMGMPLEDTPGFTYGLTDRALNQRTRIQTMRLGESTSANALFILSPVGSDGTDGGPVGWFGSDYLQNYDVEIDLAGGKVNLFSQDHCPGKLVYWAPEFFKSNIYYVGKSPIHRPMLDLAVDGRPLRGLLDTGASVTTMRMAVAEGRFDLSPDSPDMQKLGEGAGLDDRKLETYLHTFQSFSFGEITLRNTKMAITPIDAAAHVSALGSHIKVGAGDEPDVLVGMSLLKQLHLAISYSENAIYYTVATPKQAASQ